MNELKIIKGSSMIKTSGEYVEMCSQVPILYTVTPSSTSHKGTTELEENIGRLSIWSMLMQLLLEERDSLRQKPILEFLVE